MPARDYTSAPVAEQLGIPSIIAGLCADLDQLRKGEISVNDAMARSMLAKQIFNGVRIYMNGTKLLSNHARVISARDSDGSPEGRDRATGLDGAAATARAEGIAQAPPSSPIGETGHE